MIRRQTLLEVAAAGPAAGAAASLACLLLGLGLSVGGLGGVSVEPSAFEDSLLVGIIGTTSHPYEQQALILHFLHYNTTGFAKTQLKCKHELSPVFRPGKL